METKTNVKDFVEYMKSNNLATARLLNSVWLKTPFFQKSTKIPLRGSYF